MRKSTLALFLAGAPLLVVVARAETLCLTAGAVDVVVATNAAKATRIAADEMTNLLSRVFGTAVPLVSIAAPGRKTIMLDGTTTDLPRDAFRIVIGKSGVRIEGCDSSAKDPESIIKLPGEQEWGPQFERATLFGVYEFLEKVAGCRFYFPGELGTIIPRRPTLNIPFGTVIKKPFFTVRRYGYADGAVPLSLLAEFGGKELDFKRANYYRLRMETEYVPCCHGLKKFRMLDRYGESHPEYFNLGADARRKNVPGRYRAGLFCFSSAVTNEVYEDIRAYLKGERFHVRNPKWKPNWLNWPNAFHGKVIDVMPQDDMSPCACEMCQAAYMGADPQNYATEQIWTFTRDLVRRLEADGFRDFQLTQMAYSPYGAVPKVDIPSRVRVMLAQQGPWCMSSSAQFDEERKRVRAWNSKLGRKVWLWNYADKVMNLNIPGPPLVAPRVWGGYYKAMAPDILGAFVESETERWLHNYLNYYVFSRVAWNPKTDIHAILAEHDRLMFGPAAGEMRQAFDIFERKWVRDVVAGRCDSPVGPAISPPSSHGLWRKVYSDETMSELERLFEVAVAKTVPDSLERRRAVLFRAEYLEPLVVERERAMPEIRAVLSRRVSAHSLDPNRPPFRLRPTVPWAPFRLIRDQQVATLVRVAKKGDELMVDFSCEEPRLKDRRSARRHRDDPKILEDDSVTLYISTDLRHEFYRITVNSSGSIFDAKCTRMPDGVPDGEDVSWNTASRVNVLDAEGGWRAEIVVSLAEIPWAAKQVVANFCRTRMLSGSPEVHIHYLWGEGTRNFQDCQNYTTILLEKPMCVQDAR